MNLEGFSTLTLLVGTNPLPNFVTTEYFLTTNTSLKTIILIYSEDNQKQSGTKKYVDNLQELLKSRHGDKLDIKKVHLSDVGNAEKIQSDLKQLKEYLETNSSVHFNYTGGTKVMGIHVYRWLEQYANNNIRISFSYLDARNFCIVSDGGEISEDLREKVSLSIDEIIKLHGFKRKNDSQDNIFKNAVEKFKEMIKENRINNYFDSYKGFFRDEKNDLIIKTNKMREKIQKLKEEIKPQGAFLEIIKLLPEDYRPFNDDGSFNSKIDNKRFEKAAKFLDGEWLECFIYDLLNEKKGNESKITVDMDWEIKKKSDDYDNEFQIDVVLVKGYQLIGISCTTSDKKALCKGKGFEIFMRTRQIAGEESRAILITRLKEAEKIKVQQELEVDTGGKKNILVLGAEDFKNDNLITQIEDYIQ